MAFLRKDLVQHTNNKDKKKKFQLKKSGDNHESQKIKTD